MSRQHEIRKVCLIGVLKRPAFYICSIFFLIFLTRVSPAEATGQDVLPPKFTNDLQQDITSGYVKLIWEAPEGISLEGKDFQLQESGDAAFSNPTTLYTGADLASFISGLANGTYYYRLRFVADPAGTPLSGWSDTLTLTVQHHSLRLAEFLFAVGALVFLTTVFVLFKGLKDCEAGTC